MKKTSVCFIPVLFFVCLFISSCKTYYIPIDSFRKQFAGFDSTDMIEVTTRTPIGRRIHYKTYPIDFIKVVDKKGLADTIPNSPQLEVRITDTANKKTIFYFDLMRFDGQNITGGRSRIMPFIKKTIPIKAVKMIEIQNGRKNFHYIK